MKFWEKAFSKYKISAKLIILIFSTKFAEKGYFWSKTENVNIAVKFLILKIV